MTPPRTAAPGVPAPSPVSAAQPEAAPVAEPAPAQPAAPPPVPPFPAEPPALSAARVQGEAPAAVEPAPTAPPPAVAAGEGASPPVPAGGATSEEEPGAADASDVSAGPDLPIPEREEIRRVIAEFTGPQRATFVAALRRSGRYLPLIRPLLAEAGLPAELAYLPLVESHFQPAARSWAQAVGLWQFIASTGRACGLRVDWWVDQRLDVVAATRAAVFHLGELYQRFQDWELALAAYNAGAGGVARAQRRSGAQGFWELAQGNWLRAETRRYLPKFYASVAIAREPERYGLADVELDPPFAYAAVEVDSPVDLYTLGRLAEIPVATLKALNPALKRHCTPPGPGGGTVYVPVAAAGRVRQLLAALPPQQRLDFARHPLRRGDTLWDIARRYGTRTAALAELNGIVDVRRLRPGRELVVPVRRATEAVQLKGAPLQADRQPGALHHRVRRGETVARIARRYGATVVDLLRWNGLDERGLIHPGDQLLVGSAPAAPALQVVAGERVHVVQRGDTLWGISRRYRVSLRHLLRSNELAPDHVLRPGERLLVGSSDPS